MVSKVDVLRELAIVHHVEKQNAIRSQDIADNLGTSAKTVGSYLGMLEKEGLVERVSRSSTGGHKWRPTNWRRY